MTTEIEQKIVVAVAKNWLKDYDAWQELLIQEEGDEYATAKEVFWEDGGWGELSPSDDPIYIDGLGLLVVEKNDSFATDLHDRGVEIILSITPDTGPKRWFSVVGWYESYTGTDWDDAELKEVVPREEIRVVYDAI